ncbi:MAG: cobalamin-dependent protein [Rhodospirillales bacterium]|nr:cobalamin-dependent protein [Rhodospirillales bacterium]
MGAFEPLKRSAILPEPELPDAAALMAEGRKLAKTVAVGPSPFLEANGVACEIAYKERRVAEGAVMLHAQIGYRSLEKSRRAYGEIHQRLAAAHYGLDRYGICLDWSMGYAPADRPGMPRGTGLILDEPEDFARLTSEAPVASHFGDFVLGTPAALHNTAASLAAGSTAIGNLGQYFTFRMPHWNDDVTTTAETLKALALAAAQPVDILIHSNLDDGFAAVFHDLACSLGAVLLERHIVEDLIGGRIGHCYGHMFSDPLARLAFQRALARGAEAPGTMVYGNTTAFVADEAENYASLASYLLVDIIAQRTLPSGHAINPVPVTEAKRIPEIDEIVDAHLFANRLVEKAGGLGRLVDTEVAEATATRLVEGGERFKERVLAGLAEAGIDVANPFEMLLGLRRVGARRLEELFGPGRADAARPRGRAPVVQATTFVELQENAAQHLAAIDEAARGAIAAADLAACVATTDVHEYGKILVENVLGGLGVRMIDAGVSTDPDVLADKALSGGADFIALSTYNGVALDYLRRLHGEMEARGLRLPVFIGGKLNQIPDDSNTSLPVDVSAELEAAGAVACGQIGDMLEHLARMAADRDRGRGGA